jgi:zinc D-Ala-D-Ala dipeptidase
MKPLLVALGCLLTSWPLAPLLAQTSLPHRPEQLLVVTTPHWQAVSGTLQAYQWHAPTQQWQPAGRPLAVALGRNGTAWGAGLHQQNLAPTGSFPRKREGDGKAPAGIFALGAAYAYARDAHVQATKMPLLVVNAQTRCVDDPASARYNQLLRQDTVVNDWKSAEEMRRADVLYKYGLVVHYNTGAQTQAGAGSCIFIHIWSGPGRGTAGCTALPEADLLTLLRWLDPTKRPVLLQGPQPVVAGLAQHYGLPTGVPAEKKP